MAAARAGSKDAASQRHVVGRLQQHDGAGLVRDAQDQHLGAHRADLSRRKIRHGDDECADKFRRLVVLGQLRAGPPDAERSKVDAKFVGRFASFGKGFCLEYPTNAHVDALEIRDIDGGSLAQPP